MIIKSLSRKDLGAFRQLLTYFAQNHPTPVLTHNLLAPPQDRVALAQEFRHNAAHLPPRKKGNLAYHEIISLPASELSAPTTDQILLDLARQYLQQRAPHCLAFGQIHHGSHPHIHLLISANPAGQSRRHRLSRADFATIQRQLEAYKCQQYARFPQRLYQAAQQLRQRLQALLPRRHQQQQLLRHAARGRERLREMTPS